MLLLTVFLETNYYLRNLRLWKRILLDLCVFDLLKRHSGTFADVCYACLESIGRSTQTCSSIRCYYILGRLDSEHRTQTTCSVSTCCRQYSA